MLATNGVCGVVLSVINPVILPGPTNGKAIRTREGKIRKQILKFLTEQLKTFLLIKKQEIVNCK